MICKKASPCLGHDDLENVFSLERTFRRGFSLLELIAVMAVMAVMFTLAAVTFSPSEQRAAQVARDVVIAQVNRARSHAIASGVPTAVVFAPYATGPEGSRGRMMALVEVKASADAVVAYETARVLTRWEELPKGQIFVTQMLARRSVATVMDGEKTLILPLSGQNVAAPYLLFSREGAVLHPQVFKVEICLAPAILENGLPRLTGKNQDGSGVDVIEVSRLSGRVRFVNQLD